MVCLLPYQGYILLILHSFDEPNLKASFDFNITVPESYTALSNMPELAVEKVGEGLKKVTFEKSPKMSTYVSLITSIKIS